MAGYGGCIVFGSTSLTFKIAAYLLKLGVPVSVLEKSDPATGTSVGALCASGGIEYRSSASSPELTRMMLSSARMPLLAISAVNRYIFPQEITSRHDITIINYHNSLLPKHAGMHAEAWQIFEMEKEAGVTWHFAGDGIDAGDVIVQAPIPLDGAATPLKLLKMQNDLAYSLFTGFCEKMLDGALTGTAQDTTAGRGVHFDKDVPNSGYVDLAWDFYKTSAFVRAMDYGILKTLGDGKITHGGAIYTWQGYELFSRASDSDGLPSIGGGSITLVKKDGEIVLKKIERVKG